LVQGNFLGFRTSVVRPRISLGVPLRSFYAAMSLPETMKAVANMREGNVLTYGLREVPTPTVTDPNDIIVKMEAGPLNPSDLPRVALLAGYAGAPENVVAGDLPNTVKTTLAKEAQGNFPDGVPMVVGSEGCGIVVAAGSGADAQALMGKRVALSSGATYAQYAKHTVGADPFSMFAVLPDDVTPLEGASVFVNPLTVIGFLHTMQQEGHKAIVHTAAGSQLGRMLVKYCKGLGVPLVNIVRKEEAVAALKELGAEYVINSSAETYKADLLAAIRATSATVGFDCIGSGEVSFDILTAFETVLREKEAALSFYGPPTFRQVYRYGVLQGGETKMSTSLGVGNWAYGGWLMPFHFRKYGSEHMKNSIAIAAADLKDTFSTTYGKHLSLEDFAASPEQYFASLESKTDQKFLVVPNGPL